MTATATVARTGTRATVLPPLLLPLPIAAPARQIHARIYTWFFVSSCSRVVVVVLVSAVSFRVVVVVVVVGVSAFFRIVLVLVSAFFRVVLVSSFRAAAKAVCVVPSVLETDLLSLSLSLSLLLPFPAPARQIHTRAYTWSFVSSSYSLLSCSRAPCLSLSLSRRCRCCSGSFSGLVSV